MGRPVRRVTGTTTGAWGILGGTFDPIHYAHLAIAEQAREALELAGVLFIPTGVPAHKPGRPVTHAHHRTHMIETAIDDNAAFRLSRIEIDRPGPTYSVETLEQLVDEARRDGTGSSAGLPPEDLFVFILSVEALAALPEWRSPDRLLELCRLAVVPRRGYRSPGREWLAAHFPGQQERIMFLDGPDLGHSASDIRRRAADGRSIRYLVPPAVERYILEHRLYSADVWRRN